MRLSSDRDLLLARSDDVNVRHGRSQGSRESPGRCPADLLRHNDVIHDASGRSRLERRTRSYDGRLTRHRFRGFVCQPAEPRQRKSGVSGITDKITHQMVESGVTLYSNYVAQYSQTLKLFRALIRELANT